MACRASAVKSGPRPAPSPNMEPWFIRPYLRKTIWPRVIAAAGTTISPVSETKSGIGGASR